MSHVLSYPQLMLWTLFCGALGANHLFHLKAMVKVAEDNDWRAWFLIPAPSSIMETIVSSSCGTDSSWHLSEKEPLKGWDDWNISFLIMRAAHARCTASLSMSCWHALASALPMSSLYTSRISCPFLCSCRSGKCSRIRSLSLVVWTRVSSRIAELFHSRCIQLSEVCHLEHRSSVLFFCNFLYVCYQFKWVSKYMINIGLSCHIILKWTIPIIP